MKKSKEDYLEAILVIINEYGACRVTDIADHMGYSKASVSVALKKLEEEGFVARDGWRILLTESGEEIAKCIYERHDFFAKWFIEIGVDPEVARKDACMIEHALSEETFRKICAHLNRVE